MFKSPRTWKMKVSVALPLIVAFEPIPAPPRKEYNPGCKLAPPNKPKP